MTGGARGLLIVHTGDGKGKSTAALGMLLRSLAHGHACAVVQFLKGERATGEQALEKAASVLGGSLVWTRCGLGFTWTTRDLDAERRAAQDGWARVARHLADPGLRFLLLDELNLALDKGQLDTAEVLDALRGRRPGLHVVVTGRRAPQALLEAADLVTEMRALKHPLQAGIPAQAGIEF